MAALIALAQTDIKKVLAYSTLSQLGYMIMAIGVGSYIGGLFHLITHAFFKALLFLGSGSVIHAAHHEQEMPQYGGLARKIPITAITFGIAVLAISGVPFFSGYFSKDLILAHAGAFSSMAQQSGRSHWYWAFFFFPAAIAFVTPFYMMRCWMLTFWGKPRNQHLYDHAHESTILWIPLAVLAILAVISGYSWFGASELIKASVTEGNAICKRMDPNFNASTSGFASAWPMPEKATTDAAADENEPAAKKATIESNQHALDPMELGETLVKHWVSFAFIVGLGLGFLVYLKGYWIADPLTKSGPLAYVRIWLYRRMYFDELYFTFLVGGVMALSWISATFDKYIVDG